MKINDIKESVCLVMAYVMTMVVSTGVFVFLFHTNFLEEMKVFFYRGSVFLIESAVFAAAFMWILKRYVSFLNIDKRDIITVFFVYIGFTSSWFVLIPTTVERSISVYMLSYMDQNDTRGISKEDFERIFYQQYISDFGAFDKRFKEQVLSKNIEYVQDKTGYIITDNGRKIVNLFRLCARAFNTEKWLVYPNEYKKE